MAVLVTGGAGYIGSHTCVELQNAGYDVVVLDNLSNSSEKSLDRVKAITGKDVKFYKGDILDRDILNKIFENEKIDSGTDTTSHSTCDRVHSSKTDYEAPSRCVYTHQSLSTASREGLAGSDL